MFAKLTEKQESFGIRNSLFFRWNLFAVQSPQECCETLKIKNCFIFSHSWQNLGSNAWIKTWIGLAYIVVWVDELIQQLLISFSEFPQIIASLLLFAPAVTIVQLFGVWLRNLNKLKGLSSPPSFCPALLSSKRLSSLCCHVASVHMYFIMLGMGKFVPSRNLITCSTLSSQWPSSKSAWNTIPYFSWKSIWKL